MQTNNEQEQLKQAVMVLKSVLDNATQKGVFQNMDASFTAASAFNIISNKLINQNNDIIANT